MKTRPFHFRQLFVILFVLFIVGCSKDEGSDTDEPSVEKPVAKDTLSEEETAKINDFIKGLNYDPNELLNVQSSTGSTSNEGNPQRNTDKGYITECKTVYHDIRSNFENVVMFDPTLGVIYPGALVLGNKVLIEGAPQPLQVDKAPVKIRVELPGIGEGGNLTIEEPNYQNTQAEIDKALEYWNSDIATQGYAIDADTYFEKTSVYTSEQMSLSLKVSADWATGSSFESQFDYSKSTEKRVAAALYRQVYYDVVAETPDSPAAVFGSEASASGLQSLISEENPPAYVSSVQYGRIVMIRMETTDTTTDVNLEAVLDYATKAKSIKGEIDASYEKVIRESTFNVVTIGGNAKVATKVITGNSLEEGEGGLYYVIEESADYNRENPGAPVGYTVKYLKDNTIAKIGYQTDYNIETCGTFLYDHENIIVVNDSNYDTRFRFIYKKQGTNNVTQTGYYTVNNDKRVVKSPPNGAHDVYVQFDLQNALLQWDRMGEFHLKYLSSERDFKVYCSEKDFLGFCKTISVKED
ncbi:thiol-activated cytolysin family protein [Cytophaga sp. FL35]|uniref:thiol-activated cytolysin family protein n=1 Tax=Cytophaga sp. FL35 TaxID=1904456 RepID=UPI001653762B|nr:thiol-activated cytolysin family protein [Cytophaga sp. FL35]MBC6998386.1 thiol-activated cytolysin family protein [Cytophaga sp. FL35]